MQTLLQNIRFSLRMLTRNPGLTLTVLLTLAIGIGANTAIFTVDYATLLAPLPYPKPEQLRDGLVENPDLSQWSCCRRLPRLETTKHGFPGPLRVVGRKLQSGHQRQAGVRQWQSNHLQHDPDDG